MEEILAEEFLLIYKKLLILRTTRYQILNHYGICGVSNEWFKSYLSNRSQFVSINGYDSGLATIKRDFPQRFVGRLLPFSIHINDLNQVIKFLKVDHFANDTNLLCLRNFTKKLKKLFNAHLKHLVHWQKANKISVNVKITEMVIFKSM